MVKITMNMGLINYSTLISYLSADLVHNNRAKALVFDFHREFLDIHGIH